MRALLNATKWILTSTLMAVFVFVQTAFAYSWTTLGGDQGLYLIQSSEVDSSGTMHFGGVLLNGSYEPTEIVYGTSTNGTISWTTLKNVVGVATPNSHPMAIVKLDSLGNPGVVAAYTNLAETTTNFVYYSSSNWASEIPLSDLGSPAFAHNKMDWDFDSFNYPFVILEGGPGLTSLIYDGSSWSFVSGLQGVTTDSVAAEFTTNGGVMHVMVVDTSGSLYHFMDNGQSVFWPAGDLVISGLSLNNSPGVALELSSGTTEPIYITASDSATPGADVIKYGYKIGATWYNSNLATGLTLINDSLFHDALDVNGTTEYMSYWDLDGSSNERLRVGTNLNKAGWSIEDVNTPLAGFGNVAPPTVEYDSANDRLIASAVGGENQLYQAAVSAPASAVPEFETYVYIFTMILALGSMNYVLRKKELVA